MKRILTILLTLAVVTQPSSAGVKVCKQQNLSRWHITPANYSGITPMGDDRYAVVDDKSPTDGFHIFTIRLNPRTGKITHVSSTPLIGNPKGDPKADCEDIVYAHNNVFIAQEGTSTVPEYTMDGLPTGRCLKLPSCFNKANIQNNGGFEPLAYGNNRFFLTTECPLRSDSATHRIFVFDSALKVCDSLIYRMDPPELKLKAKYYAFGIAAMTAMPDGQLLVMERELSIPPRYVGGKCRIKIYAVNATGSMVNAQCSMLNAQCKKHLVASFTTHISRLNYANYEGMCLGPTLEDGRLTLLLINDSQGGVRNGPFRLKDYLKVIILDAENQFVE